MVVLKGPKKEEANKSKNWPGQFSIDESVKYLKRGNKSPSMMGSIASRLKILKQRMNEESQDIVTQEDSRNLSGFHSFN